MCAWIIGSESIMLLAGDTKQHTALAMQARLPRQTTARIMEQRRHILDGIQGIIIWKFQKEDEMKELVLANRFIPSSPGRISGGTNQV